MQKTLTFLLMLLLCFLWACEGDQIEDEDWDDYVDVFSGPGPEEDFEKLFIKLNYDRFNNVTGEMEGPFYAQVTGTCEMEEGVRHISISAMFGSNAYYGFTRVFFEGDIEDDVLTGNLTYNGVEVYEFFYEGQRVGGAGQ